MFLGLGEGNWGLNEGNWVDLELWESCTYDSLDVPLLPFATTETVASLKDHGFSAARAVPASSSDGRRWRNRILRFVEMQLGFVWSCEVWRRQAWMEAK